MTLGGWRSGSAAPLHGDGRGFESLIAHQPSFSVLSEKKLQSGQKVAVCPDFPAVGIRDEKPTSYRASG